MKKLLQILMLVLSLLWSCKSFAQDDSDSLHNNRSSLFIELGGNAAILSVNYEYLTQTRGENFKSAFAIGLTHHFTDPLDFIVAPQYNLLIGNKLMAETGAGITIPVSYFHQWVLIARFGARYQKMNQGFYYRLAFTPVISLRNEGAFYQWQVFQLVIVSRVREICRGKAHSKCTFTEVVKMISEEMILILTLRNLKNKIMAKIIDEVSRTFNEFLIIPGLTTKQNTPDNTNLQTPLVRHKKGESPKISLNVPFVSAIMQSVSDSKLAIALAKEGGLSFIFGSQPIEDQAKMVMEVKKYKAGFVESRANTTPENTLKDIIALKEKTGFSTVGVTDNGKSSGKLQGIVTSRDYRVSRDNLDMKVKDFMTPIENMITANEEVTLGEANDIIWAHKLNQLPILDENQNLKYFVFRKDYDSHKRNPNELLDDKKQLMVGAGINTRDYKERVPALVEAGVDVLCIDSSDGFSEWQKETIEYIKKEVGKDVLVGAGNVVDKEGFLYLAKAGADFIKVGVGGGSICITREQKGIGRGQATALIDVAEARNAYFEETGEYIPICSDGGIVQDYHMTLAMAMGADFLMMGRYFARFDESPTRKLMVGGNYVKEYWGEGSNRARNWQRYDMGGNSNLKFEEGVDSYVAYAGKLKDNLDQTLGKIKSTMCSCGVSTLKELQSEAKITLVSSTSIIEGGAHDVIVKEVDK